MFGVKSKGTKLYYASDIHGSQRCFNKFINSGKFYGAEILVMGGDITGKSVLFIEEYNGAFSCDFMGKGYNFTTKNELDDFNKLVKGSGYYTYIACRDEITSVRSDASKMDELFYKLMRDSLTEWFEFAESRLSGTGIRCYVMAGNDDPDLVTDMLNNASSVENPEGKVIIIDDSIEMISIGFSNPTPWDSPRECSEEELARKIDKMMTQVKNPGKCILSAHVPPYSSGLDDAPVLLEGQKVKSNMGQIEFAPAGSTAVMSAIQKYGFLLSLHGHIHEAHAIKKIGSTIAINPGSDYGEGTLHGALITFNKGALESYQLVSG